MIPTLLIISLIVFVVIQLPPGDIVTSMLESMEASGREASDEQIQSLRARYNLDKPLPLQYIHWVGGFLTGDMGYSALYARPGQRIGLERLGLTLIITLFFAAFTLGGSVPLGIYSAQFRQYTSWTTS